MPGMQDDLYGGDGPTLADKPNPEAPADKKEGDEGEHPTFLVNKDICPGMKVGDEMVSRIVAIHENEYELEYAPKEEGKGEEGGEQGMAPEAPAGAMGGGEAGSMYG